MRKDVTRTIAGLIVVGLVVVATFLYGNHQSQDQIRRDQALEQQQQQQAAAQRAAKAKVAAAPAAPVAQPKPVAIPQTGGGLGSVLAAVALAGMLRWYLKSRRARVRPASLPLQPL